MANSVRNDSVVVKGQSYGMHHLKGFDAFLANVGCKPILGAILGFPGERARKKQVEQLRADIKKLAEVANREVKLRAELMTSIYKQAKGILNETVNPKDLTSISDAQIKGLLGRLDADLKAAKAELARIRIALEKNLREDYKVPDSELKGKTVEALVEMMQLKSKNLLDEKDAKINELEKQVEDLTSENTKLKNKNQKYGRKIAALEEGAEKMSKTLQN